MTEINLRYDALLSVQRAFLGEIAQSVRAVAVDTSNKKVVVTIYIEDIISEDYRYDLSCVETEVLADFPNNAVEFNIIEDSMGGSKIFPNGEPIYLRKEN